MLKKIFLSRIAYSLFKTEAKKYSEDKEGSMTLASKAEKKAKKNELSFKGIWERFTSLLSMIKAWASGEYKTVPYRSLLMILVTILYFVSPIDLIPDFLFGIGLLDDVALLTFVLGKIDKDLQDFKEWENKERHIAEVIVNDGSNGRT